MCISWTFSLFLFTQLQILFMLYKIKGVFSSYYSFNEDFLIYTSSNKNPYFVVLIDRSLFKYYFFNHILFYSIFFHNQLLYVCIFTTCRVVISFIILNFFSKTYLIQLNINCHVNKNVFFPLSLVGIFSPIFVSFRTQSISKL